EITTPTTRGPVSSPHLLTSPFTCQHRMKEAHWVQKEIEEAFRLNRIVVPVLLSGADRLRQDDLPAPLVRLAFLQYLRFDYRNVRQDSIYMAEQLARVSPSIGDRYVAQLRRSSGFRSFLLALGKGWGREQRADTLPTSHV
ncbi:hypothetical protein ABZ435_26755, partial [Streptomyces microflavus]